MAKRTSGEAVAPPQADALADGADDGADNGADNGADDGADDDAFEAARDALAADAAPSASGAGAPSTSRERVEHSRRVNRWRARDFRRKAAGEPVLTEAEHLAMDARSGAGSASPAPASPKPGAPASASPSRPRARATREELESELATLRARFDAEEEANIRAALGETARSLWDIARRFTPNRDRELADHEAEALGEVWGKVLGPRLQAMAHATPMVIAIGVSYRVLAPRVESAFTPAPELPSVAAGSASRREVSGDDAPPAVELVPGAAGAGAEVPPGADPRAFGYSPEVE